MAYGKCDDVGRFNARVLVNIVRMKLFVKLMMLVLVLAVSGPFFLKGPDGQPLWSIKQFTDRASTLLNRITAAPSTIAAGGKVSEVVVYRWQDEQGQWHFSGEPPVVHGYDVMSFDPDTYAMRLLSDSSTDDTEVEEVVLVNDGSEPLPRIGPITDPEATRQLIEDARAIQDLVDQRKADIAALD